MKLFTAESIKEIDQICEKHYDIPTLLLMEKAGKAIYEHIVKKDWTEKKFAVVCGSGNNGGDGLVVARYLYINRYDVTIYLTGNPKSQIAKYNLDFAKKLNIKIKENIQPDKWVDELRPYDVFIDGIFGIGYRVSDTENIPIHTIKIFKLHHNKYVYSIDIPSGVNGDTGKVGKDCIYANETLTLCGYKIGLLVNPGKEKCGKITCLDIGVPNELLKNTNGSGIPAFTEACFIKPERYTNSHKGTYGHVGIIGGRANMTGAGAMCALAAYKTGCGYVSIASPEKYMHAFSNKITEAVISPIKGEEYFYNENSVPELKKFLKDKSSKVLGPGLGKDQISENICLKLIKEEGFFSNLILDADALWAIRNHMELLPPHTILTPHPKEMTYLTGLSLNEIQNNRLEVAEKFAKKYGVILVLKGNDTITTNGTDTYINTSGCDGMATAGSGDVLAGIIAGITAQAKEDFFRKNSDFDQAFGYIYYLTKWVASAVWLHGHAGELAQKDLGFGMTATDIIRYIKL